MPVLPALKMLRQEDPKFEDSLKNAWRSFFVVFVKQGLSKQPEP